VNAWTYLNVIFFISLLLPQSQFVVITITTYIELFCQYIVLYLYYLMYELIISYRSRQYAVNRAQLVFNLCYSFKACLWY